MNLVLIGMHQLKLLLKSPTLLLLFTAAPLAMIFIFGQAFSGIFAQSGSGIRAIDYFGVTLFTMLLFQGCFIAVWAFFRDRKNGLKERFSLAPSHPLLVLAGQALGCLAALLFLAVVVLLACRYFLSVNYGSSFPAIVLPLLAECVLAVSLGLAVSVLTLNERATGGLLNALVPLLVLLGGGYFMIPESGPLHTLAWLSPLRWVNLALLEAVQSGINHYTGQALLVCLVPAGTLAGIGALRLWRRS